MTNEKTEIPHERETTSRSAEHEEHAVRPRRPRRGSELKFPKPKMSYAATEERLAKAIGTQDEDFLHKLIHQIVAAGELGDPSDDLEVTFLLSAMEDILSNESNNGAAKAMVAAQFAAVHVQIVKLARSLNRTIDPVRLDILGRLFNSLARTSVAQYQALTQSHTGVTVGHVSVNQGGQAIVGSVTQNQQEAAAQNAAPPQPLLTDAKAVPMPIIEESDKGVPVPISRAEESKR